MPYLDFEEGPKKDAKPIAIVRGGSDNGKIVQLHLGDPKQKLDMSKKTELNLTKYEKHLTDFKPKDRQLLLRRMERALLKDTPSEYFQDDAYPELQDIYEMIQKDVCSNATSCIQLHDPNSVFDAIPVDKNDGRDVVYLNGASGSGKTHCLRKFAENYKKLFPDREIYMVSELPTDKTLEGLDIKRIDVQSLVDEPMDNPVQEFSKSMVCFDDFDALSGKKEAAVIDLINKVCSMGRHESVTVVITSHLSTRGAKTRLMLNEATLFQLFPQGSSQRALQYLCSTYLGLSTKQIQDLKKMNSRWVLFGKNFPQQIVSEHECKLLHRD